MHLQESKVGVVKFLFPKQCKPNKTPILAPHYSFNLTADSSFLGFPPHWLPPGSSYMSCFSHFGASAHTLLPAPNMFPFLLVQLMPGCLLNCSLDVPAQRNLLCRHWVLLGYTAAFCQYLTLSGECPHSVLIPDAHMYSIEHHPPST